LDPKTTALWRIALKLGRRADERKAHGLLPPLFFVTDPVRTPDPVAIAGRLPKGAGIIYRTFGARDATAVGRALRRVADERGLVLLIGADEGLAAAVGADGVHLPERLIHRGPRLRARRPHWLLTGAAHGARALNAAKIARLDAALASPVFASHSPSAHGQLGPIRFASLVRGADIAVYALGGVNCQTASRLLGTGAAGVAAVEGLDVSPGQPQRRAPKRSRLA
jgi:thiamine-phosphate pyrophosphorylase